MQHFRKVTSLQEDMQKLGLTKMLDKDINPRQLPAQPQRPAQRTKPQTESRNRASAKAQLAEAKQRRSTRKQIRESRMVKKAAVYETRLQRIDRSAKKNKQKVEARIRVLKGLDKRVKALESYDITKALKGQPVTAKVLKESFSKVASLAGNLARAFGLMENFFGEAEGILGIPVMHAGSAYGYDTAMTNVADGGKTGDATDYSGDAKEKSEDDEEKPSDNIVDEGDEDGDNDADKDLATEDDNDGDADDVVSEDDDADKDADKDLATEDDDVDADKDLATEDDMDGDKDADKDVTEDDETTDELPPKAEARRRKVRKESREAPIDFELHSIRLEAEEQASNMVGGAGQNVNLGYATELLNDMVSYLGGAMKLYWTLQNSMTKYNYLGQDAAPVYSEEPTAVPENPAKIGIGQPQGDTAIHDSAVGTAPKSGDATDMTGKEAPKAESTGKK